MLRKHILAHNRLSASSLVSRRHIAVSRVLLHNAQHHHHHHHQSQKEEFDFDFLKVEERSSKDIVRKYIPADQIQNHSENLTTEKDNDEILGESPFRNPDGSLIHGENATEARLDPKTLLGKIDHSVERLPKAIAEVIQNNILVTTLPSRLRQQVVAVFKDLNKNQIQQSPSSETECNAYIAALFLQDFSHIKQVILELQKRVGKDKFNPQRVLDIGYGPATGMVALNDVMGDQWIPEEKTAYVIGRRNSQMKKNAKIILSRQLNENTAEDFEESEIEPGEEGEQNKAKIAEDSVSFGVEEKQLGKDIHEKKMMIKEKEKKQKKDSKKIKEEKYLGPIDSTKINIRTTLRDTIPTNKQYDLIMVHHSLLSKEYNFPKDVDENLRMILRLLAPGGHLLIVERGNAVGFETVARARQVMIRPERFPQELGKIPRPYIKGSLGKPQKLKKESLLVTDEDIEFEKEMLAKLEKEEEEEKEKELREQGENLENVLDSKFGKVSEEELRFDEEDDGENFEIFEPHTPLEEMYDKIDYHIKILAPCPHHRTCPLQLGDPKFFKIPSHKHRLNFCSFSKTVERPDYTMELKKGKMLATKWDKTAHDGIGTVSRGELKKLAGTGRPGGRNTEDGSYSYLIAERSLNDQETLDKIDNLREYSNNDNSPVDTDDIDFWPRIVDHPSKIKRNVKMTVCSNEGDIELWQIPKSLGKQVYHDARKAQLGDQWALGRKTFIKRTVVSPEVKAKLEMLYKTQKKTFLKEQKKQNWKKITGVDEEEFDDGLRSVEIMASKMEKSREYIKKGKEFDVDPASYEGK
ncbi:37S ribosomal protein S22 [Lodderomyces elongisporus]|uniref:37S ribosomal protein S22 n=1 Tax=Lodderomyces elongisporus TaxID=36914 RepID=UPI0029251D3E|nr:37S ribosomal protein S22 [Lodderomyces elongisporus]WLF77985.1 37S ribosomal protein S22 [Lodderomyces elongisporus]